MKDVVGLPGTVHVSVRVLGTINLTLLVIRDQGQVFDAEDKESLHYKWFEEVSDLKKRLLKKVHAKPVAFHMSALEQILLSLTKPEEYQRALNDARRKRVLRIGRILLEDILALAWAIATRNLSITVLEEMKVEFLEACKLKFPQKKDWFEKMHKLETCLQEMRLEALGLPVNRDFDALAESVDELLGDDYFEALQSPTEDD